MSVNFPTNTDVHSGLPSSDQLEMVVVPKLPYLEVVEIIFTAHSKTLSMTEPTEVHDVEKSPLGERNVTANKVHLGELPPLVCEYLLPQSSSDNSSSEGDEVTSQKRKSTKESQLSLELIDIDKEIGSGMFSSIFVGFVRKPVKESGRKLVALKELKEEGSVLKKCAEKERKRTEKILIHMQQEKIPGVNKVLGFVEYQGRNLIAMKYCNTGNLHQFLQYRSVTLLDKVKIARSTGIGIVNLYKAGYLHHDIKLDNIFVHEKQENHFFPSLGDFGFVDRCDPPSKMPRQFNVTYAPRKALKVAFSNDQEKRNRVWNNRKYDDFMFGFLIWQVFSENYDTTPWEGQLDLTSIEALENFQDFSSLRHSFRLKSTPGISQKVTREVNMILSGLLNWGSKHITAEEAVHRLQRLEEESL